MAQAEIGRETTLTPKLVDALYTEAMVLADEARAYFEDHGTAARDALPADLRVSYAVESLKATTRIMHAIAWLIARRNFAGPGDGGAGRRLGEAQSSDADILAQLPEGAREIIEASEDLYARVARFERDLIAPHSEEAPESQARGLLNRLERIF